MADFTGTTGDDTQDGTSADETFDYSQGGNDRLNGLDGNDTFLMGAEFSGHDRIDGGAGYDILNLSGNYYPHNVIFRNATLTNVEEIVLETGFSNTYGLTLAARTVREGEHLLINASTLTTSNKVTVYGDAARHGTFSVFGGAGYDNIYGGNGNSDVLMGGDGGDEIIAFGLTTTLMDGGSGDDALGGIASAEFLGGTGDDRISLFALPTGLTLTHVSAGRGDDRVIFIGNIRVVDGSLDGGAGYDTVEFTGTNILDVSLFSAASSKFEMLRIPSAAEFVGGSSANVLDFSGFDTDFTGTFSADGAGGDDRLIAFKTLATNFTGAGGNDTLVGGMLTDHLYGGEGRDRLFGNDGTDILSGGAGADRLYGGRTPDGFEYAGVTESTGRHHDVIASFNASEDRLVLGFHPETDAPVTSGILAANAFDSDMAVAVNATVLAAGHAVLFTPDSGGLAGRVYLIVDANGVAGYQANEDYVIRLANGEHLDQFSANNFI